MMNRLKFLKTLGTGAWAAVAAPVAIVAAWKAWAHEYELYFECPHPHPEEMEGHMKYHSTWTGPRWSEITPPRPVSEIKLCPRISKGEKP